MNEENHLRLWRLWGGIVLALWVTVDSWVKGEEPPNPRLKSLVIAAEDAAVKTQQAWVQVRKELDTARKEVDSRWQQIQDVEVAMRDAGVPTGAVGEAAIKVEAVPGSSELVASAPAILSIANKVHVLIIALPEGYPDLLTPGARANANFIRNHLNYNSQGKADIQEIGMADFEAQLVLAKLRSLNVTANDTLFVYVALHGNFDGTLRDGHQFQIRNRFLTRKDLRAAINATPARQKILMTDTCSPDGRQNITSIQFEAVPQVPPTKWPLSRLLLYHAQPELIDITAASEGQIAVFRSSPGLDGGGLFTRSFVEASYSADESGRWDSLFRETRRRTEEAYRKLPQKASIRIAGGTVVKQTTQTPLRFEVP